MNCRIENQKELARRKGCADHEGTCTLERVCRLGNGMYTGKGCADRERVCTPGRGVQIGKWYVDREGMCRSGKGM